MTFDFTSVSGLSSLPHTTSKAVGLRVTADSRSSGDVVPCSCRTIYGPFTGHVFTIHKQLDTFLKLGTDPIRITFNHYLRSLVFIIKSSCVKMKAL